MGVEWLPDSVSSLHEIPFAGGCCILMEKDLFYDIGQFDDGIRLWGEEDSELCIRAWLLGYRVLCFPQVKVGHLFRPSHPYSVQWSDVVYNRIRFAFSHFSNPRLSSNLRALQTLSGFNDALLDVLEGDVLERRERLIGKRIHDDFWFFSKFPMAGW
jgi:GT2 family glycosyltransferase